MKQVILSLILMSVLFSSGATRYLVSGGSGVWSNSNNWSTTSGGPSGSSAPTTGDDVFFDGSGNVNISCAAANVTIQSLTVTSGYTSTLAIGSQILTVLKDCELGANMTITGTNTLGALRIGSASNTSNIRSNGYQLPITVLLGPSGGAAGAATLTLLDDWTFNTKVLMGQGSGTGDLTINGFNVYAKSDVTLNGSSSARFVKGTTVLNLTGTGTITNNSSTAGIIWNPIVINTAGTITISFLNVGGAGSGSLTYVAGTVNASSAILNVTSTYTLNTSGISWESVIVQPPSASTYTITLSSTLTITGNFTGVGSTNSVITISGSGYLTSVGTLTLSAVSGGVLNLANNLTAGTMSVTSNTVTLNGYTVSVSGNFTITTGILAGTTVVKMTGSGNVTSSQTTNYIGLPFEIASSGTYTFVGTPHFHSTTFTHTSGTTAGGTSTVKFAGTMAVNGSGLNFNVLDLDGTTTFTSTGTYGWTTNNLTSITGTHTYKSGATYTINSLMQLIGTLAAPIVVNASTGGVQANIVLDLSASQTNGYVNATDINSSAGQTVYDFQGSLSNTTNWNLLTVNKTTSYTF